MRPATQAQIGMVHATPQRNVPIEMARRAVHALRDSVYAASVSTRIVLIFVMF